MSAMAQQTEKIILEGAVRTEHGTGAAHAVRREGLVPGVVYGEGSPSVSVQVILKDLHRALKTKAGENVLLSLRLKDQKAAVPMPEKLVLIKELQQHPVTHQIIHVDFYQVSLTKKITVAVKLAFKGEAIGVKQEGGILEHLRWELDVECLPTEIPPELPVDVSGLSVGATLEAKAIVLPAGVRLVTDPNMPVLACVIPKAEEAAPAAAEPGAETAEPEVLKQKKPEELAAEEAQAREKKEEKGKEEKKKE